MKIEKIKNQMDMIKKLLMKLYVVSVFAHKRVAKGIPLNHLEVVAFIAT
jgi:urease gamma subunit